MKPSNKYLTPKFELTLVQVESSIANSSAQVSGGDNSNNYQPQVESWLLERPTLDNDEYKRGDI